MSVNFKTRAQEVVSQLTAPFEAVYYKGTKWVAEDSTGKRGLVLVTGMIGLVLIGGIMGGALGGGTGAILGGIGTVAIATLILGLYFMHKEPQLVPRGRLERAMAKFEEADYQLSKKNVEGYDEANHEIEIQRFVDNQHSFFVRLWTVGDESKYYSYLIAQKRIAEQELVAAKEAFIAVGGNPEELNDHFLFPN